MKTIGMIGGMSWESSLEYYRMINKKIQKILGGSHSSKNIMYSVDFNEIEELMNNNEWNKIKLIIEEIAIKLDKSGADIILICTNTIHKVVDDLQKKIEADFVHITDATGEKIINENMNKVALLGTKFTMEEGFYKSRLKENYNIDVLVPNRKERNIVHNIIFNELIYGEIKNDSRNKILNIIQRLSENGAEGVVLGCTEIPLLIKDKHCEIPVFDTMKIHANKAVKLALK